MRSSLFVLFVLLGASVLVTSTTPEQNLLETLDAIAVPDGLAKQDAVALGQSEQWFAECYQSNYLNVSVDLLLQLAPRNVAGDQRRLLEITPSTSQLSSRTRNDRLLLGRFAASLEFVPKSFIPVLLETIDNSPAWLDAFGIVHQCAIAGLVKSTETLFTRHDCANQKCSENDT